MHGRHGQLHLLSKKCIEKFKNILSRIYPGGDGVTGGAGVIGLPGGAGVICGGEGVGPLQSGHLLFDLVLVLISLFFNISFL